MPAKYSGPIRRVATAIPQVIKNKLENHLWCIFTDDAMTQNSVAEYLATVSEGDNSHTRIMYSGKEIPVISVPFKVVMFLKNNKARLNYKYTAYHKERKATPWVIWKEGTKTPPQMLRNLSSLFC